MTTSDLTRPVVPADEGAANDSAALDAAALAARRHRKRRGKLVVLGLVLSLISVVALVFGWYMTTHKPLSQLPGMETGQTPNYSFSIYGVTRPLGVAVSPSGDRIYVTQSDGPRDVRVFNHNGKQIGRLTPPASTGVGGHTPVYVAINPKTQDVYVSDRFAGAVYVYDEKGTYLRKFDPSKAKPTGVPKAISQWAPLGLAFGSDGTFYVTDVSHGQRVLAFAPDFATVRVIGSQAGMSFPNGVVADENGNLEVTDSNNGRLLVFDRNGTVAGTIGHGIGDGDLGLPRGVAVNGNKLFVVDATDHMVRIYKVGKGDALSPTYLAAFGSEGRLDGTFEYPNGIAVDSRARIYVTDRENNRVQVWTY